MAGMRTKIAGLVLLGALACTTAQATLITFDPDDYAAGTVVSGVNPHVNLSSFRLYHDTAGTPAFAPVYASNCYGSTADCATTGTKVFGDGFGGIDQWGALGDGIGNAIGCFQHLNGAGSSSCTDRFNVMLMTFTDTTDFVEISGAYWAQDETYLYGFDDAFNLVGTMTRAFDFTRCNSGETDYCKVTTTLNATGGIRYVLAGGWSNGTSLDNLRFNGVPEPGTLALLGLGLAGVAAARRRKLASVTAAA